MFQKFILLFIVLWGGGELQSAASLTSSSSAVSGECSDADVIHCLQSTLGAFCKVISFVEPEVCSQFCTLIKALPSFELGQAFDTIRITLPVPFAPAYARASTLQEKTATLLYSESLAITIASGVCVDLAEKLAEQKFLMKSKSIREEIVKFQDLSEKAFYNNIAFVSQIESLTTDIQSLQVGVHNAEIVASYLSLRSGMECVNSALPKSITKCYPGVAALCKAIAHKTYEYVDALRAPLKWEYFLGAEDLYDCLKERDMELRDVAQKCGVELPEFMVARPERRAMYTAVVAQDFEAWARICGNSDYCYKQWLIPNGLYKLSVCLNDPKFQQGKLAHIRRIGEILKSSPMLQAECSKIFPDVLGLVRKLGTDKAYKSVEQHQDPHAWYGDVSSCGLRQSETLTLGQISGFEVDLFSVVDRLSQADLSSDDDPAKVTEVEDKVTDSHSHLEAQRAALPEETDDEDACLKSEEVVANPVVKEEEEPASHQSEEKVSVQLAEGVANPVVKEEEEPASHQSEEKVSVQLAEGVANPVVKEEEEPAKVTEVEDKITDSHSHLEAQRAALPEETDEEDACLKSEEVVANPVVKEEEESASHQSEEEVSVQPEAIDNDEHSSDLEMEFEPVNGYDDDAASLMDDWECVEISDVESQVLTGTDVETPSETTGQSSDETKEGEQEISPKTSWFSFW